MSACIEWTGWRNEAGYGLRRRNGRNERMHRVVMAELHGDEAIAGKVVMHTCDNPPCVNPEHLCIGTQRDNLRDMSAKGRFALPINTKLTAVDVDEIRRRVRAGERQKDVAADFGVIPNQVWKIVHGHQWRF